MAFEKAIAETIPFTTYYGNVPTVPTNPVPTISKDGGAFAACTNAVTSVASGYCTLALTATEKTADRICLRVTSDNCDARHVEFLTEADWTTAKSARIDENVSAAKTLADGAITAAKVATGAIDADALATDAVTEIVTALFAKTGLTAAGVVSFNTILKCIYAMARGKFTKSGNVYTFKDDDDSTTLFTLTIASTGRTTG